MLRWTGTQVGRLGLMAALGCGAGGCYEGSDGHAGGTDADSSADAGPGSGGSSGGDTGELPPDPDFPDPGTLGPQGLRRQSIVELSNTLQQILGVQEAELTDLLTRLPEDSRTPFDNDYLNHEPSQPLVEGMVSIVEDLAALFIADPARRDALLGCTPSGPSDAACLRQFVERFGRLALRRPLAADEVDAYAVFIAEAEEDGDFNVAFELALSALLLDAEFLYLVETGEPTAEPDTIALDDFAMASRLSFLLWGSGPDDALLDKAAAGQLASQSGVHDAALELLADPKATVQLQRLHAMWLGYAHTAQGTQLAASLRTETDKLVERVVEGGSWVEMFRSPESFLDETLSDHYDIPLPGGQPGWVEYPDIRRGGLLSHGSFLALGNKPWGTSPTERGKVVWTRLLCRELPPPPPDVDTGLPPTGGGPNACKKERWDMSGRPECKSCHELVDGIGFGLENYGPNGEWRTVEPDNPACSIDGYGEFVGGGRVRGAQGARRAADRYRRARGLLRAALLSVRDRSHAGRRGRTGGRCCRDEVRGQRRPRGNDPDVRCERRLPSSRGPGGSVVMPSLRINRRSFLTGLGGVAVALPFLEAMLPRNAWAADTAPCRYVAMFAGVEQLNCVPSSTGSGYTMPSGFASLEAVRDHVMIATGTAIEGTGPSGITPPGGKTNPHHGNIMKPLLTGYRSTKDDKLITHSTPDQLVADLHGLDTKFRSLEYKVQAAGYRQGAGFLSTTISYEGSQARAPQRSPQLAFESLFSGFVPPDANPADIEAHQKRLERKLSVLDLVKERGDHLVSRVSRYDKQRLERHFDEIRDLETRLADIEPVPGGAGCDILPDPGADPAQGDYTNTAHGGTAGYSDEDARGKVFVDLIHMALKCELTRVATLVITHEQCMMSTQPLWGIPYEMHDITHHDEIPNRNAIWDEITSWHAGFFAQLVEKLAEPEPTGGSLLDSTVVVLMNSGGRSGHGANNLCFPIAGPSSVFRIGEHVSLSGHPSTVFQTLLHGLGIDQDLGDLPGLQPSMLV